MILDGDDSNDDNSNDDSDDDSNNGDNLLLVRNDCMIVKPVESCRTIVDHLAQKSFIISVTSAKYGSEKGRRTGQGQG